MKEDEIVEIGARAHFNFEARRRFGRSAPTWENSLTETDRDVVRSAFAAALTALSEAGLAVDEARLFDRCDDCGCPKCVNTWTPNTAAARED